ncbi:MAG TPA: NAD(P)/FAD-dependent oxidoreductase [Aestuariivirga sp.]|nr:NAD(P)/FAD-dependent oxidoreductase [Aestuariivirga sp.]
MMVQNPDVVIVGAGAAGIGAGLGLTRLGIAHLILEAKQRVGGRAYSDTSSIGHLWDHGAHWLHSGDVNVLRFMAEKLHHKFRPQNPAVTSFRSFIGGQWKVSEFATDYVWTKLEEIVKAGRKGSDVAAESILDPGHAMYPLLRHWCQLIYSKDPAELSTQDAGNYSDSHVNLPVEDGYGALVGRLSRGLPIRLGVTVKAIEAAGQEVRLETSSGTVTAKACILAVPARMMEKQRIAIRPGLPAAVQQAFADVTMGYGEKVALGFDRKVFEGFEIPFADVFDPLAPDTRPLNFELHPFGRPIAVAHVGGSVARELAKAGPETMKGFAIDTLVKAFGADIRQRIVASAVTGWTMDEHIGGAYSGAAPGKAEARKVFSEPVNDRIFLAGEHVHRHYMATVHGAYETGVDAAHKAAALLGFSAGPKDPLWLPS